MVLETRASDSKEPSMRSSRWKRSWEGSPNVEEHEARNLVTFEVRTTPSSRLSMRVIDPGRTLFINLFFIFQISNPFGDVGVLCKNGKEKGREKSRKFCTSGTYGPIPENGGRLGGKAKGLMRKMYSLAQNITVLQGFRKQPPFSIFSHRADATSTKATKTSNSRSIGNTSNAGSTALSPYPLQPG